MHKAKRCCCDGNECNCTNMYYFHTCGNHEKNEMCLVRHTSNHSTQEAMEESHVQSYWKGMNENTVV